VPKPSVTPELLQVYQSARTDMHGELPAPMPIIEASETLNQLDGYELSETDQDDWQQQWQWDVSTQLIGQFLIDRDGIVRWINIECDREGVAGLGKFPTAEDLLAAARVLVT
jgi:hypothetical protein